MPAVASAARIAAGAKMAVAKQTARKDVARKIAKTAPARNHARRINL